jgi:penicillin-binding protein 1A
MTRALAGHSDLSFAAPDGIVFVEIDRDSGKVAGPFCTRVLREAFIAGTEPFEQCNAHTVPVVWR